MAERQGRITATGSCLCGKVRFVTRGELRQAVACHCNQCRKMSGHFLAATKIRDKDLTIDDGGDEGDGALKWYSASEKAKRGFCGACGSTLFWRAAGTAETAIFMGCLDSPTGIELAAHIFVADKGDYYSLDDDLPKLPRYGHGIPMPEDRG